MTAPSIQAFLRRPRVLLKLPEIRKSGLRKQGVKRKSGKKTRKEVVTARVKQRTVVIPGQVL